MSTTRVAPLDSQSLASPSTVRRTTTPTKALYSTQQLTSSPASGLWRFSDPNANSLSLKYLPSPMTSPTTGTPTTPISPSYKRSTAAPTVVRDTTPRVLYQSGKAHSFSYMGTKIGSTGKCDTPQTNATAVPLQLISFADPNTVAETRNITAVLPATSMQRFDMDESLSSNDVSRCPTEVSSSQGSFSSIRRRALTPTKCLSEHQLSNAPPPRFRICSPAAVATKNAEETPEKKLSKMSAKKNEGRAGQGNQSIVSPFNFSFPLSFTVSRSVLQNFVSKWSCRHQENPSAYKDGGYMIAQIGDILQQRYLLLHKLGWGEFSTVWLAYDRNAATPIHSFVAIKIAKCHPTVLESSRYETNLLKFIRRHATQSSQLLDSFEHRGTYGHHLCMVMPVYGSNLLCIIDQMKGKRRKRSDQEIRLVKDICTSVLIGLAELDNINVIHTDLKPENILSASPDPKVMHLIQNFLTRNKELISTEYQSAEAASSSLVCIADFGLSVLLEPPNSLNDTTRVVGSKKEFCVMRSGVVNNVCGTIIQTREYRAPEILFGMDFNPRSDIWSLGCIIFELITGDFLMDPKRKTRVEREMDIEHVAMIMQLLGPVPPRITSLLRSACPPRYLARFFNESGQFLYAANYRHYPRRTLSGELETFLDTTDAELAAHFIMSCFSYDPADRPSARELLKHPWIASN